LPNWVVSVAHACSLSLFALHIHTPPPPPLPTVLHRYAQDAKSPLGTRDMHVIDIDRMCAFRGPSIAARQTKQKSLSMMHHAPRPFELAGFSSRDASEYESRTARSPEVGNAPRYASGTPSSLGCSRRDEQSTMRAR
jgi:hypothetical protein